MPLLSIFNDESEDEIKFQNNTFKSSYRVVKKIMNIKKQALNIFVYSRNN